MVRGKAAAASRGSPNSLWALPVVFHGLSLDQSQLVGSYVRRYHQAYIEVSMNALKAAKVVGE